MSEAIRPFEEQGNFTQFHNAAIDYIMPRVSGSAWKVLTLVIRNTRGHHKQSDEISYNQIIEGTGIASRATVSQAIKDLLAGGYILSKPGKDAFSPARYALNRKFEMPASEIEVRSSEIEPESRGSKNEPVASSKNELRRGSKIEHTKESTHSSTLSKKEIKERLADSDESAAPSSKISQSKPPKETTPANHPIVLKLCEYSGLDLKTNAPTEKQRALTYKAAKALIADGVTPEAIDECARRLRLTWPWTDGRPIPPEAMQANYGPMMNRKEVQNNGTNNGQTRIAVPARVANDEAAAIRFIERQRARLAANSGGR